MDDKLLEIICCPETHQPLRRADVELVTNLNQRIEAGTLFDRVEEKVGQKIDGGEKIVPGAGAAEMRHTRRMRCGAYTRPASRKSHVAAAARLASSRRWS